MPWYALSWLDSAGIPVKREVLFRDSTSQVWDFVVGRGKRKNGITDDILGIFISEATADESWDFDIEEPRERTIFAQEVPLIFGEKAKIE